MATLFTARHEAGTFAEYTTSSTNGGDCSIATGAALGIGAYGMSNLVNDATAQYGLKDLGANNTNGNIRVRVYIDPNGMSINTGDGSSCVFFYAINSTGTETIFIIKLMKNGTNYGIRGAIIDDGNTHRETSMFDITDDVHYVEMEFTRATSAVASDATLETWIDGVAQTTLTGVDSYDRSANLRYFALGKMSTSGTVSGTYYVDELVVNDDGSTIGPVGANVSDSITTTESVGVALASPAALNVSVSDSVAVTENYGARKAIQYITAATTDITVATASPVVNAPSGVTDGELLLMFLVTNTNTNTSTPIAGWARVGSEVDAGTDATTAVYWKIASGEGASWTMTSLFSNTQVGRFVVMRYANANASPINTSNQSSFATATSVAGPTITTTTDNALIIQMVGTDPQTGTTTATPDSSPVATERFDGKDGSNNGYIAVQEYSQPTAGAIALDYTGLTSDTYGGHQFAINPLVEVLESDAVAVSESVSVSVQAPDTSLSVNKSDTITTTEAVAASVGTSQVSKSDTIGTTESVTASVPVAINKSDSITITESVSAAVQAPAANNVNVSDTIGTTESVTASVGVSASASDTIGTTENKAAEIVTTISKSETVATAESVAASINTSISASDAVAVTESHAETVIVNASASDAVTVSESVAASVVAAGGVTVNVSDTIGTAESVAASVDAPQIAKSEVVTVGEAAGVTVGTSAVNVSDAVSLGESVAASVQAAGGLSVSVSDGITVSENKSAAVTLAGISVSETVTLNESASELFGADVFVTETIATTENVNVFVNIPNGATLSLSVSDGITLADRLFRARVGKAQSYAPVSSFVQVKSAPEPYQMETVTTDDEPRSGRITTRASRTINVDSLKTRKG